MDFDFSIFPQSLKHNPNGSFGMKYWLVKNSWGARKYHPKNDGPKVSFFSDDEETTSTPKADALFIPRENPRALVIRPLKQWPGKSSAEKLKNASSPAQTNGDYTGFASSPPLNGRSTENGNHSENGTLKEQTPIKTAQKQNGGCDGGEMEDGFEFIVKNKGINTEVAYPYQAVDGTCNTKEEAVHAATITGYEKVTANSESALLQTVANQPVSVAIDASGMGF
ncbi:cysteine protease XCP2-like [Lactuca sativa]|uniref:cysteine protease XCP2-like n=1 Tax=Lactuca sativa TaxID=4236 RepID=UPI0022AF206B|nr:cysteine protease XCP2-like [Lactuca sativa]